MSRKHEFERYEMTFRKRPQSKTFIAYRHAKEWKSMRFGEVLLAVVKDMDSKKEPCRIFLGLENHPTAASHNYGAISIPGYPLIDMGWKTRAEIQDLVDAAIVEDVHSS